MATERLAMTQPGISRMLAGIERMVGTPVFIRHPIPTLESIKCRVSGRLRRFRPTIPRKRARAIASPMGSSTGSGAK
ncbi:helix-turn-helix domain-containing protein [Oricola nitratireducens]|uniref:helix-turn-helix domain-containing protein n=1 Tax=Oricola nitratireducens TaxID=2775868 RepID=UPI003D178590